MILGIGADDVFILYDAWLQSAHVDGVKESLSSRHLVSVKLWPCQVRLCMGLSTLSHGHAARWAGVFKAIRT